MQERLRFRTRWLAVFCLLLMFWAAVAESTHTHANKTESPSCSICAVAHSSAPAADCNLAEPVFTAIGLLQEEEIVAKSQPSVLDLGIRGPPAA